MQKGYWEDGTRFEFDGVVTAVAEVQGGLSVRFEKTYFFPESGGQLADGGMVGSDVVLAAQQNDEGPYVVLARGACIKVGDVVSCSVDVEKRLSHTQLHTAQHILSRLLDNKGIRTLSFHMTEDQASIEIDSPPLTDDDVSGLEDAVERVIWSCLPVQTLLVSAVDLPTYNVRKVPELAGGPLRLVRIGELDTNPCGGTHVASTGEIGNFVVVGADKVRGNVRLYFAAGRTATAHCRKEHQALERTEQLLTCGTADVVAAVGRLQQRERDSGRQVRSLLAMAVDGAVQEAAEQIASAGMAAVVLDWVPAEFARMAAAKMDAASGPFCIVVYPAGGIDGQFVCTVPAGREHLLGFFGSQMKELYGARMGGSGRTLQGKVAARVTVSQVEALLSEE
jgi:alanyl-tRNA synthetase